MSVAIRIDDLTTSQKIELQNVLTLKYQDHFGKRLAISAFLKQGQNLLLPFQFGLKYAEMDPPTYKPDRVRGAPWGFKGTLRPNQAEVQEKALPILRSHRSVCCFLPCAWGKTVQAMKLMADLVGHLGGTGLVLFTLKTLAKQWLDASREFTTASVFQIGEKKDKKVESANILVGMASQAKHITEPIDVLVLDEAHLFCTQNHLDQVLAIRPRYLIVLTATPDERDDNMEKILYYLGGGVKQHIRAISQEPFTVYPFKTGFGAKDCSSDRGDEGNEINPDSTRVLLDGALAGLEERQKLIVKIIQKLIKKTNFKICVIADRVDQINDLYGRMIIKDLDVEMLVGNIRQVKDSRVLIGGIKKMGTGWDQKSSTEDWDGRRIDLLLMAISTKKMTQVLGRVQRASDPVIIQLIDAHRWYTNSFRENRSTYETRGGIIKELVLDVDGLIESLEEDFPGRFI